MRGGLLKIKGSILMKLEQVMMANLYKPYSLDLCKSH